MTDPKTTTEIPPHRTLPPPSTLTTALQTPLITATGTKTTLQTLLLEPPPSPTTSPPHHHHHLIIFIRHFFCGSCEQYLQHLRTQLSTTRLAQQKISVHVVGCGQHGLIPGYRARVGCPEEWGMVADEGVEVYRLLGMTSTLRGATGGAEYLKKSMLKNTLDSTWNSIASGKPLAGGPSAQNGGEFVFRGGELVWCHRMRNPVDHGTVAELKEVLGYDDEGEE